MVLQLKGIHHLTAVTSRARENLEFYTGTLGMRLIKKTVNQDDVSAYHLFYGDGAASPGADLTFFDFRTMPERHGTRSVVRTGLRVNSADSLAWWERHLTEKGVRHGAIKERAGHQSLEFEDFESQRFRLVVDETPPWSKPWAKSPIPTEHQILGLGPITMSVPNLDSTRLVLTQVMNMREVRTYPARDGKGELHVFEMGDGGPSAELHVSVDPDMGRTSPGAGGVHHVAFRTENKDSLHRWIERLSASGIRNTGEVERFYFTSLYFREPGGVLFEIATDEPGFTADEPLETLGESLSLPPFLEGHRNQIEAGLVPLPPAVTA